MLRLLGSAYRNMYRVITLRQDVNGRSKFAMENSILHGRHSRERYTERERVRECWYPFDQISYMRRINILDINKNKKICDERAATERVLLSSTKENIRRNMRVASTVRIWLRCKNMKSINEVFSLQIFFIL